MISIIGNVRMITKNLVCAPNFSADKVILALLTEIVAFYIKLTMIYI